MPICLPALPGGLGGIPRLGPNPGRPPRFGAHWIIDSLPPDTPDVDDRLLQTATRTVKAKPVQGRLFEMLAGAFLRKRQAPKLEGHPREPVCVMFATPRENEPDTRHVIALENLAKPIAEFLFAWPDSSYGQRFDVRHQSGEDILRTVENLLPEKVRKLSLILSGLCVDTMEFNASYRKARGAARLPDMPVLGIFSPEWRASLAKEREIHRQAKQGQEPSWAVLYDDLARRFEAFLKDCDTPLKIVTRGGEVVERTLPGALTLSRLDPRLRKHLPAALNRQIDQDLTDDNLGQISL